MLYVCVDTHVYVCVDTVLTKLHSYFWLFHYQICDLQIFPSALWIAFVLCWWCPLHKVFHFDEIQCFFFFFFCCLHFCHTQRWWSLIYPLVSYGYYSYYLLCLKSYMHLINMSPVWGCSDPLNHSFVFYHVIAVHTGNNSLLPPLQKLTGKLPESAGISECAKVLN